MSIVLDRFYLEPKNEKQVIPFNDEYVLKISLSVFSEHNHKEKPLYYYPPKPIESDELIVSVSDNSNRRGYDKNYNCLIKNECLIYRERLIIKCFTRDKGCEFVLITAMN